MTHLGYIAVQCDNVGKGHSRCESNGSQQSGYINRILVYVGLRCWPNIKTTLFIRNTAFAH